MSGIPSPNKLYLELRDQLVDDDVDSIKAYLNNNPLSPRELQKCKTFPDICNKLKDKQKIKPDEDDYTFLEHMFESLEMLTLKDKVKKFAADCRLRRIFQVPDARGSTEREVDQSTEPKPSKKRKNGASECRASAARGSKKRKIDQSSEPKSSKKSKGRGSSGGNPKPSVSVQSKGSSTQAGNFGNVRVKAGTFNQNIYMPPKQAAGPQPKRKHGHDGDSHQEQEVSDSEDDNHQEQRVSESEDDQ